jgi:hypothetical protein
VTNLVFIIIWAAYFLVVLVVNEHAVERVTDFLVRMGLSRLAGGFRGLGLRRIDFF